MAELDRRSRVLDEKYRSIRKKLSPAKLRRLQILQKRWIEERKRKCLQEEREIDGTLGMMTGKACLVEETDKRIEWLKKFR